MRCVYLEREIYFKDLAHTIGEAGKPEIHRVRWQPGDPWKSRSRLVSPKTICWQNFFLLEGGQFFYPTQVFT